MNRLVTYLMLVFVLLASTSCGKTEEPEGNQPPGKPTAPTGADTVLVSVPFAFQSTATDPDGDSVSLRFAWGDGDTSTWSAFVPSGTPISREHAYASEGTYQIRTQARDIEGNLSDWSDPKVVVVVGLPNQPPTPYNLTGIDTGYVDSSYTFQCTVSDPDGDQVAIRFAWGDGDTTEWSDFRASGTTFSVEHTYSEAGVYMVSAQAKDENGNMSNWIAPITVVIRVPFPFVMTVNSYPDTADLVAAVQAEFGPEYTIADWNEVKNWCQEHSAAEFISNLGWELGEQYSLLVTWNGEHYWQGRHYYMTRFDHDPPFGYLIHDDIEDNYIVLGSWSPVSFRILAIRH